MEDLGTYSAFFEQFRMSIQLVTDYVLEKLSTAAGIFEEAAVQDPVEFLENEFGLFQINRTGVRLLFRSVWMLDASVLDSCLAPSRWFEPQRAGEFHAPSLCREYELSQSDLGPIDQRV